jgi:hypothetical protein
MKGIVYEPAEIAATDSTYMPNHRTFNIMALMRDRAFIEPLSRGLSPELR